MGCCGQNYGHHLLFRLSSHVEQSVREVLFYGELESVSISWQLIFSQLAFAMFDREYLISQLTRHQAKCTRFLTMNIIHDFMAEMFHLIVLCP